MSLTLRAMQRDDWPEVGALIFSSTNAWYEANGRPPVFSCPPEDVQVYCQVYESLDPGCCILAEEDGQLLGSCFYHPRDTHVALGIMNAHPDAFGRGVARALLDHVIDVASRAGKPVRLVSSAMNLDSFSLYNRRGFVPVSVYQDMLVDVPADGFPHEALGSDRVRPGTPADLEAMVALEREIAGIDRRQDFEYFLRDPDGLFQLSVLESRFGDPGALDGFLVAVQCPATSMLGPGVMRSPSAGLALIAAQLGQFRGGSPVFLVPADCPEMTAVLYDWGARNCELHVSQVLGTPEWPKGIVMPTFLPETG